MLSCTQNNISISIVTSEIDILHNYIEKYHKLVYAASEIRSDVDSFRNDANNIEYLTKAEKYEREATDIAYKYNKLIIKFPSNIRYQYNLYPYLRKVSEEW